MSYKSRFYPEYHLFSQIIYGDISLDELRAIHQEVLNAIEAAETPFHMLFDLRRMQKFPTSIAQMKEVMHPIDDPNLRWIIMITNSNTVVKFVMSVLTQVLVKNARFRLFNSYEEAFAFLEEMDSTLDLSALLPVMAQSAS